MNLERKPQQIWEQENSVLVDGQIGFEMGNRKLKIGDGVTVWKSLPYTDITTDFLQGNVEPTGLTGLYYLNTTTEDIYKNTAGVWTVDTNLKNELPLVRRIFRIAIGQI